MCEHTNLRQLNEDHHYYKDVRWVCLDCGKKFWGGNDTPKSKVSPNKKIQRKVASLKLKLEALYDQIDKVQEECVHTTVNAVYKGDSGNWDPGDDSYWIEHTCQDCGKRWTAPQ